MAKKDKKSKEAKKARAAEKQKKNLSKAESKNKKLAKKQGDEEEEDEDIDTILANYAKEQEEFTEVKIEVCKHHPHRRLNPTMVLHYTINEKSFYLVVNQVMGKHLISTTICLRTQSIMIPGGNTLPRMLHYLDRHMLCVPIHQGLF